MFIQFSCKKSLIVSRLDKEYYYTCDLFSAENIDFWYKTLHTWYIKQIVYIVLLIYMFSYSFNFF